MANDGAGRREEKEAVRTTIVGGRPPGSGTLIGAIPRGIEILTKKAAVDAEFRRLLLEKRAEAAGEIGLKLTSSERMMLATVPAKQLEMIIAGTKSERKGSMDRCAGLAGRDHDRSQANLFDRYPGHSAGKHGRFGGYIERR